MIGWLSGRVLVELQNGATLIDVKGVGYEVHVAAPSSGLTDDAIELFIYTVVREDAIQLFGFFTLAEREFFELLISTPGVGPSTALGALRTMSVGELARAIESDDAKKVATISGIGPKTASRIVLELKGKVPLDGVVVAHDSPDELDGAIEEALRTLGYSGHEIREALKDVTLPENENDALRTALAMLRR